MDLDYLKRSISDNELQQKKNQKKKHVDDKILSIVRDFIVDKKLICYGGTAINDILPKEHQFYNYETDIPDYDFFSPNAMLHAKELCNIFAKENVHHIESKSAFVHGTYKIFVNFVAVADITQVDEKFYKYLSKNNNHIKRDGVLYTPPSYLRMSLHQELARPLGDISRWEKIYSRLQLFNKYFPLLTKNKMKKYKSEKYKIDKSSAIVRETYDALFKKMNSMGLVFCNFDIVIRSLHKYMKIRSNNKNFSDIFIVYSDNLNSTLKELRRMDLDGVTIKKVKSVYKFVDNYAYIYHNGNMIGIILSTNSCLAYNTIKYKRQDIKVGNIDTLMNLYFTLILIETPLDDDMILEVIDKLHRIVVNYREIIDEYEIMSSIPDRLKRFTLPCYGTQLDREDILKERSRKFKTLKNNKRSKEYKEWFFKYSPRIRKTRKILKKKKN